MQGRVLGLASAILLWTAACHHSPQHTVSLIEEWSAESVDGRGPANLLVDPGLRESEDVVNMLVSLVGYLADSCVTDTTYFLSLGNDSAGTWIDPPRVLVDRLTAVKIDLRPVSEAHLAPLPRPLPGQIVTVRQPARARLLWSIELREWVPGVRATLYLTFRRGGATVTLSKAVGGWIVEQWVGPKPWLPNKPLHPAAESGG
jgi:hypothetical protein